MDVSLPPAEVSQVQGILQRHENEGVKFHALRTRSAAARGFISMHLLVPGEWSVQRSHQLAAQIETEIRQGLPGIVVFTHVEPLDDPIAWQDSSLDRE